MGCRPAAELGRLDAYRRAANYLSVGQRRRCWPGSLQRFDRERMIERMIDEAHAMTARYVAT